MKQDTPLLNPDEFVITRKRKKYKFAHFSNYENCFEVDELTASYVKKWQATRRLTLEVGAGTAYFSLELAKRHPERCFIAVDAKADRLCSGAKQALETGVGNIIFVRAHANQLETVISASTVSAIWLTFSDPFPKKRHAKNRLTHPDFLHLYASFLKTDGQLLQKTDNLALFDWSLEQLAAEKWRVDEVDYDLHASSLADDYKIMTTYEAKFAGIGLPTYLLTARLPIIR